MPLARPRAQPVELIEKPPAWPAQMRGKHVHQADIRYIELGHHDFARVYIVDIVAGRHIAGVRHEKIVPAQDGDAFTVPVKADMRPVGMQMIVLAQPGANDLGSVGVPIPAAICTRLAYLLQANHIDIEVVDRLGDLAELGVLVLLLIAVQVQGEDLQPAAPGEVVGAEIVVPDRPAWRFAPDRVLDAKRIVDPDLADPDTRIITIGVSCAVPVPLIPVRPVEEAGRNLRVAPVVRRPVNVDALGLQGVAYSNHDWIVALPLLQNGIEIHMEQPDALLEKHAGVSVRKIIV